MDESPRSGRVHVDALDAILGNRINVLDDGFVRVVDYMGGDESVVQAARVSYGVGTKRVQEDRALIRYLLRHEHTTPFEMCEIKLHVRVPMDCWRQWIRHRTASVNEYSTRYSVAIDAVQRTRPEEWRLQGTVNRQGSHGRLSAEAGKALSSREAETQALARTIYEERLAAGIAREQARKDLPLSTYTEAYWKVDLHNLLRFLRLRMSEHAQAEIREYATTIGREIVGRWCPFTWEAFQDYSVESLSFSKLERPLLAAVIRGDDAEASRLAFEYGWLSTDPTKPARNRERTDLEGKLRDLGLTPPWETKDGR